MSQASRLTAAFQRIGTEFKTLRSEVGTARAVKLTKSQYQALTNRDGSTMYLISDWIENPGERVANGSFTTGASNWNNFGSNGKSVSNGIAVFASVPANSDVNTPVKLTGGKYYQLTFTISGYSAGAFYGGLTGGGNTTNGTQRSANGTFTERIQATAGQLSLSLQSASTATLNFDDVSLMGPYETATVGGS